MLGGPSSFLVSVFVLCLQADMFRGLAPSRNKILGSQVGLFRLYSQKPYNVPKASFAPPKAKSSQATGWRAFGQWLGDNSTQKKLTKVYVAGFGVCCIFFYYYMRDKYYEEKFSNSLKQKFLEDPDSLNEYEHLRLKLVLGDKLKVREQKTYDLYQALRKEQFRSSSPGSFHSPSPEELQEWYDRQPKRLVKKAPVPEDEEHVHEHEHEHSEVATNKTNPNIMEPADTTEFYDGMASAYDDEVKWEERAILMGMRRSQIMSRLEGDVLEIACGTGRNIPYLHFDKIDSITFLDSSPKMVEVTRNKFREQYPKFSKVAFTVGKAEDLLDLTGGSKEIKYDTIVETFGLCSHEDPVRALKNMVGLLRPGGRIVLLEHGRSNWDFINNHLDFRAEKRMKTWACRWNLDIGELIEDAGLDVAYEKRVHFGTTWMLVCKRPEDPIKVSEKTFLQKLFGTGPKTSVN
ncbi:methyltransferase Oms1p, mitochondrial [[Candida] railenensis]|uniref:Methyltransferase Oms1p, mitochondrial n=1 Tax=[Candida] railenensis TaxID=45579 RepID=A0A9P0VYL5_9ASCO|nr:methyltransferase Oms1p, mitochondrial [[Candida] railenensis]